MFNPRNRRGILSTLFSIGALCCSPTPSSESPLSNDDKNLTTGGAESISNSGGNSSSIGGDNAGGAPTSSLVGGESAAGGGLQATSGGTTSGGTTSGGAPTRSNGGGSNDATGGNAPANGGNAPAIFAQVEKDGESLIALSGLQIVSYGGYLNGESFQQDAIITHQGYQYSAFWNANRNVVLTRRKLPDSEWEKFDFTDYTNNEDDAHNTISLGVSPADGSLHLAFDHHGSDLHYRRSTPGLVTNPESTPWLAANFLDTTSVLAGTTRVTAVTYPRFITEPGGDKLLLAARIGQSGSGDEFLWEYDANDQTWVSLGKFIDGVSDSVNAYLHGLSYGPQSARLHMAWCWRGTPDPQTNHDLFYSYSEDHGRTWLNNEGTLIATTATTFITRQSSGAKVFDIAQNRGLINQEHMAVDNAGRVHVLVSHLPDAQGDDPNFTSSRTKTQFFHYFRDPTGTWSRQALGLPSIENFRGSLAVSSSNNVYAILPNLRIAGASSATNYSDWALLTSEDSRSYFSDPLLDSVRLLTEDKLTIYSPQAASPNIWALDYTLK